jgi:hypothetical protein
MGQLWTVVAVLALCACGSTEPGQVADAAAGGSSDGGLRSDAGTSVDGVTCQTHTRTVVNADSTKVVTDTRFALVAIAPDEDFVVESCNYTQTSGGVTTQLFVPVDGACPAGATCSNTGPALPTPTNACSWNRLGTFFDGKLYVFCGTETRNYNAGGALTSTGGYGYASIRVHR